MCKPSEFRLAHRSHGKKLKQKEPAKQKSQQKDSRQGVKRPACGSTASHGQATSQSIHLWISPCKKCRINANGIFFSKKKATGCLFLPVLDIQSWRRPGSWGPKKQPPRKTHEFFISSYRWCEVKKISVTCRVIDHKERNAFFCRIMAYNVIS